MKWLNEIVNADSFVALKEIPTASVDLVCTDPPYLIGAKGCGLAGDRAYLHNISDADIDGGFDFTILTEFERVCKTVNLVIFCGRLQIRDYLNWIAAKGYTWNLICWHKTNPTPLTNNNYLPDTEYIFHIWQDRKLTGSYETKKKFYVSNVIKNDFEHPTVKPLDLLKNLIQNATDVGGLVLDPFAGSGTTLVASKQLKRNFIGMELSPDYCKIAENRVKSAPMPLF